jgi:hypothetical protein
MVRVLRALLFGRCSRAGRSALVHAQMFRADS